MSCDIEKSPSCKHHTVAVQERDIAGDAMQVGGLKLAIRQTNGMEVRSPIEWVVVLPFRHEPVA